MKNATEKIIYPPHPLPFIPKRKQNASTLSFKNNRKERGNLLFYKKQKIKMESYSRVIKEWEKS